MTPRERWEEMENIILSPLAAKSAETKGRREEEAPCPVRSAYARDRDRILHSKSFRRLKHKTQVFIAPEGDHYRTRLTHTLEVAQIAITIARALRLNEDLTWAIALGHDLGHTPFGHTGETVLNALHPNGFRHYEQSIRVVDFLETSSHRQGLNLTEEVRDGIVNHSGGNEAATEEGKIIKFADRIAYINHDIDDALRAGILTWNDLPQDLMEILGDTHSRRISTMISAMITYGEKHGGRVGMEESVRIPMMELRQFMFSRVYLHSKAKSEDDKVAYLLETLYRYYRKDPHRLPENHRRLYRSGEDTEEDMVCDWIAGMTDPFAVKLFQNITMPSYWKG